jgi:hypothetical protein
MLPARWLTGATCQGRPRHCLPVAPKCRHRGSRRWPRATRKWVRARDKQLALPKRTSGRSALVWCPAGRVHLSRREPHPAKRRPHEKVGGAAGFRPLALRWLRPPRLKLLAEAPVAGKVVGLGIDAERTAGGGVWRRPPRLQSLLIQGGGAPDVHVSLIVGGGQGPTSVVAGVGDSAPERAGERVAAVEAVDQSGAAPESAGLKRAAPEQGLKRGAPEQDSSDRPVKKPRVHSKM